MNLTKWETALIGWNAAWAINDCVTHPGFASMFLLLILLILWTAQRRYKKGLLTEPELGAERYKALRSEIVSVVKDKVECTPDMIDNIADRIIRSTK